MKKLAVLFAFLLIPFLIFTGCTKKKLDNNTLYVNLSSEPPTADPNLATDSTSSRLIGNIFDGLLDYDFADPKMPIIPKVAKSWDITKKGKVYTFHLRDDVLWSDGKRVTAYDFEYSWRRLLTPATASEYASFLFDLVNAEEFNSGKVKDFSKVGLKALNADTFQVTLKEPVAYFLHIPTFEVLSPVRKDIVEKFGDTWTEPKNIVTNGPFIMTKWKHDYEIILERNEKYYGPKAKVKTVRCFMVNEYSTALSLYQTGKIDIIREVPPIEVQKLKTQPDFHSGNYFSVYYVGFATKKPPMDNPYVRKAFNAAVKRPEVIVAQGDAGQLPTTSLIPSGMLGYNEKIGVAYNIKQAHKYMEKAGYRKKKKGKGFIWINKKTGKPFPELEYMYNTNEGHKTIAENLQAQWKRNLGVKVNINNQEWKVYLKTLQVADKDPMGGSFHLFRMGWIADYPDPDNFMNLFMSYNENNHTQWGDPKYDRMVENAKSLLSPKKRARLYDKAQKLLLDDVTAIIPLYLYAFNVMYDSNVVKGVHMNPLDTWQYDTVYLNRK